ncbi:MAG: hypothetical protein R2939_04225 [Kofleriaceae bacterium]
MIAGRSRRHHAAAAFALALSGCGAELLVVGGSLVGGAVIAGPMYAAESAAIPVELAVLQVHATKLSADVDEVGGVALHDGTGFGGDLVGVYGGGPIGLLSDGRLQAGHYGADAGYGMYGQLGQRMGPVLSLSRRLRLATTVGYEYGGYVQSGHQVPLGVRALSELGPLHVSVELHRSYRWPTKEHVPPPDDAHGWAPWSGGGQVELAYRWREGHDDGRSQALGVRVLRERADGVVTHGIAITYGVILERTSR